jgi:plasmid replication initiation protein
MKIINSVGEEIRYDGLDYIREDNNNLLVKKDNKLVFTKCDLSLVQMRIILVCLSLIYKDDLSFKPVVFSAKNFLNIIGIGEKNSTFLNKELKAILSKPIETIDDTGWTIYSWFTKASCKKGKVEISINPELTPFLLNLRKNFTAYPLNFAVQINNKYNIKLYEIFSSVLGGNLSFAWHIGINEFKKLLNIKADREFFEIKQKILNKIETDMSKTDIKIDKIILRKKNRKVVELVFNIVRTKLKIRSDVQKILFNVKEQKLDISQKLIERYRQEYEEIDILKEIEKFEKWVVRKTNYKNLAEKDWTKEIGNWLKRKSDGRYFSDFLDI